MTIRNLLKWTKISAIVLLILVLSNMSMDAQCSMCRAAVETGGEGDGLNKGILYLLLAPYTVAMGLAYVWWKNRRRMDNEIQSQELKDLLDDIN